MFRSSSAPHVNSQSTQTEETLSIVAETQTSEDNTDYTSNGEMLTELTEADRVSESDSEEEYAEIKFLCKESKFCTRKFKSNTALQNHIAICHNPANALTCEQCGKLFNRKKYLKKHMLIHNKPPVVCNVCGIDVCEVCGNTFDNRAAQRIHNKTCFKKENRAKYDKLKDKENQAPFSEITVNEGASNSQSQPAIISSFNSPVVVERLPVTYETVSFYQF